MEADSEYENDIVCAFNSIEDNQVTVAAVIDQLQDTVVNAYDGTWFEEYKSKWLKRIHRIFEKKYIPLAKSRAAWDVISAKVIAKLCSGDYNFQDSNKLESAVPQPRITSHSRARSSTSVCAATTSAPTLSSATASALPPLTSADKANVAAKYDSMDVEKMWMLSTGTIVEQKMRERAMNESREHPAHSLILDANDGSWLEYFEENKLVEIRSHRCTDLPPMPEEVETYLEELKGLSPQELYTKLSSEEISLNSDIKWVQESFSQSVRLLQSGFVPISNITEGGLLKRVWGCVDTCFDF